VCPQTLASNSKQCYNGITAALFVATGNRCVATGNPCVATGNHSSN
jgi:hypothetical protein